MRVCFVVGCESTREYPGDTPEAFWRVLLPSKRYGNLAVVVGSDSAAPAAIGSEVVWIYEPTCEAAAVLAETMAALGKPVVVDFSEDIWRRGEQDRGYARIRLQSAERAMTAASVIVAATARLADVYAERGPTAVVETVVPADGWKRPEEEAGSLGWWSDGRQKRGFELVAPGVRQRLEAGARVRHIQFSHHAPLVAGLSAEATRAQARRLGAYFADDLTQSPESNVRFYRDLLGKCTISLECYAPGAYADSVSDVPLLRAAASGVPSLTTRSEAPAGCVCAPAEDWGEALEQLLTDAVWRGELASEGLHWAQSRQSYDDYDRTLEQLLAG